MKGRLVAVVRWSFVFVQLTTRVFSVLPFFLANEKKIKLDPNAMAIGPPANDITAPPISGGLGMIPTGLKRSSNNTSAAAGGGMISMGGGEGESEQRFDAGGYETKFSMGGAPSSSSSSEGGGGKGGGWWPFGGGSS